MGHESIKCGALLEETIVVLEVASRVETLDEFMTESNNALSCKSLKTKKKYIEVIKDRFLQFTEDGRLIHTPLLSVINIPIEDSIKKEIIFYHLILRESLILQILYYLYNFLPQKKEISKSNFKSSVTC